MASNYLVYWKTAEIQNALASGGHLSSVTSKQLKNRGLGDRLWVCGLDQEGEFVLIGYLDIDRLVSEGGGTQTRGEQVEDRERYSGQYLALAREGNAVALRRVSLEHLVEKIRFIGSGADTLGRLPSGRVNGHQLQTHRKLTAGSAKLLKEAWDPPRSHSARKAGTQPGTIDALSRERDVRPELRTQAEDRIESYVNRVLRNKGFLVNLHFLEVDAEALKVESLYRSERADPPNGTTKSLEQAHVLVLFDSSAEPHSPFAILGYPESERDLVGALAHVGNRDHSVSLEAILSVPATYRFDSLADFLRGWHWTATEPEPPVQSGYVAVGSRPHQKGSSGPPVRKAGPRERASAEELDSAERLESSSAAGGLARPDADWTQQRASDQDRGVLHRPVPDEPGSSGPGSHAQASPNGSAELTVDGRSGKGVPAGHLPKPATPTESVIRPGKADGDPSSTFEQSSPWKDWAIVAALLVLALAAFFIW